MRQSNLICCCRSVTQIRSAHEHAVRKIEREAYRNEITF